MGSVIYIPKKANPIFYPEYGALYNWYAISSASNLTSSAEWRIPTLTEFLAFRNSLGTFDVVGGYLKEIGLEYWYSPNTEAINSVGFNARGAGFRSNSGIYSSIKALLNMGCYNQASSVNFNSLECLENSAQTNFPSKNKKYGVSVRPFNPSTSLSDGQTGTYIGNDGKVYRTICIGTQEWLADNLCETRFRNGDIIPWHGATPASYFTNAEWAALTTAGVCAYDNTLSNVATGFTFPT